MNKKSVNSPNKGINPVGIVGTKNNTKVSTSVLVRDRRRNLSKEVTFNQPFKTILKKVREIE